MSTLDGFDALYAVSNLTIDSNSLVSLDGMALLQTVDFVIVRNNQALVTFGDFGNSLGLDIAKDLIVTGNSVTSFGTSGIQSVRDVLIHSNSLHDFTGLNHVTSIRDFYVTNCPALNTFSGLSSLNT